MKRTGIPKAAKAPGTGPRQAEAALVRALRREAKALARLPNVVATGVGRKRVGGQVVGGLCPVVFVSKRVAASRLKDRERIPPWLAVGRHRVATDVIELGRYTPFSPFDFPVLVPRMNGGRFRPVQMGVGVRSCRTGQDSPTFGTGTLGVMVRRVDDTTLAPFGLSTRHVLRAPGDDVVQPPSGSNRSASAQRDFIGSVAAASPSRDVALATLPANARREILGLGRPGPVVEPLVGMPVMKSGLGSGVTHSTVAFTSVQGVSDEFGGLGGGPLPAGSLFFVWNSASSWFSPTLRRPAFAAEGDSGSWVMVGAPLTTGGPGLVGVDSLDGVPPPGAPGSPWGGRNGSVGLLLGGLQTPDLVIPTPRGGSIRVKRPSLSVCLRAQEALDSVSARLA